MKTRCPAFRQCADRGVRRTPDCDGCTRPCELNITPLPQYPNAADPVPKTLRTAKTKPEGVSDACWRMELDRRDRDTKLGEFAGLHPDPERMIF